MAPGTDLFQYSVVHQSESLGSWHKIATKEVKKTGSALSHFPNTQAKGRAEWLATCALLPNGSLFRDLGPYGDLDC